ncbi:MAG TPA: DUF6776 family protein [Gammaproteobacteria bacterium]|nr:DUF6776 family protein [Gammaproteobacteria bacterium]
MSLLIIKHHRPYQIALVAICISLALFVSIWFFLDESHWSFIKSRLSVSQQARKLFEENRRLVKENAGLKEQVIMLQRTTQIDSQAAAELHEEMKKLQDDLFKVRGELEFYRGIMSSTGTSTGLNIQGLQLRQIPGEQSYYFKLILTQVAKDDKVVEGTVEMTLEGVQNGVTSVLNVADLMVNPSFDFSFKFRSFKRIEGNIMLPEGFIPQQVTVRLHPGDKNLSNIKRVFNWVDLTG